MPLGAFRLNTLGRVLAEPGPVQRTAITLTAVGNAQIDTAQGKFGGSSALFDGTADYITVGSIGHSASSDFTIEGWVRFNSLPSVWAMFGGPSSNAYVGLRNFSGTYAFGGAVTGASGTFFSNMTITTPSTGVWYHWAMAKSGGTLYQFWDGTLLTTTYSSSGSMSSDKGWTDVSRIGNWNSGTDYTVNGHLDEIRFSDLARYTTGFTPSTTPFVNDDDTLLLVHCDGTDASTFFDDDNGSGRSPVSMIGKNNVQIDTAQYKFGSSSALFDGVDDYIALGADTSADQVATIPTTGEFTIECWVRLNTVGNYRAFVSQYGYNGQANPVGRTLLYMDNGNKMHFFINGGPSITGTTTVTTGQWYHVAATRDSSNDIRLFVDGTQEGGTSNSSAAIVDSYTAIGALSNTIGFDMDGHIDEIRISDVARYTGNFTPSTTPFENDANTVFLTHFEGTDTSTDFRDDNGQESA